MNNRHLFFDLIREWSPTVRLVGSTTGKALEALVKDSGQVLQHLPDSGTVVDVGSGAGFPGIVIAASNPDLHVTALEPHRRKWAFLRAARRHLELENFVALCETDDKHRQSLEGPIYDAAVSKAAFAPAEWLQRGTRLVRPGGIVVALAGEADLDVRPELPRRTYRFDDRQRAVIWHTVPSTGS